MSPKYFLLTTTLFITLFSSCKTIIIHEKSAFKESSYKIELVNEYINSTQLTLNDKEIYTHAAQKIIQTNEQNVLITSGVQIKRNFFFVNDSISLEYFIIQPNNIEKTGMFYLGNGTNIFNYATKLIELSTKTNSKIYVLNYRGYGKSSGIPSFKTQFTDNQLFVENILEFEKKPFDFIIGYSLGSIFGTYTAVDNKIQQLYLLSPFSSTSHFLKYFKRQKTKGLKIAFRPFINFSTEKYLREVSNIEKLKGYSGKLTVLHGREDTILPFVMGEKIFNSFKSKNKNFINVSGGHGAAFEDKNWKGNIESIKLINSSNK